jgi:hypothetical protein
MVPYFYIQKKGQVWIGTVAIGEQLYFYRYPFQFTNYFKTWKSKYQLHVKIQIIQVISATSLKKQFRVEEFLNQFNISNSKQTQLKQIIITVLDEAINDQLIKAQFKILTKDNSVRKLTKLTTQWITKSKVIYLYEIFNYKELISTSLTGLD